MCLMSVQCICASRCSYKAIFSVQCIYSSCCSSVLRNASANVTASELYVYSVQSIATQSQHLLYTMCKCIAT